MPAEPATQATDKFDGVMSPVVAHTSWTGRDGAPQNVSALAQTTDGYLWMGTPFGLFRFDGIDFASYPTTSLSAPLPSTDIEALSSDAAGGLWIGFRSGGISHLRANGAVENYNPHNHLGPNSAQNFIVCNDGAVWAVADYRLYRLAGNHWENFGVQHGLSGNPLFSIFLDKAGTLWTSTRSTLFALKKGQSKFEVFPTKSFMIVGMILLIYWNAIAFYSTQDAEIDHMSKYVLTAVLACNFSNNGYVTCMSFCCPLDEPLRLPPPTAAMAYRIMRMAEQNEMYLYKTCRVFAESGILYSVTSLALFLSMASWKGQGCAVLMCDSVVCSLIISLALCISNVIVFQNFSTAGIAFNLVLIRAARYRANRIGERVMTEDIGNHPQTRTAEEGNLHRNATTKN